MLPTASQRRRRFAALSIPDLCICIGLAVAVAGVYGRTARFAFINYDDDTYILQNPTVRSGLSAAGLRMAFTQPHVATWHPLTTLSHMADCSLFGVWAGGHHLVNVFLHVCNTLLLFGVLGAMTGARWRSAFVAAIFGLHPLHVESVAWVAERKDVLSTLFSMLTLAAYYYYVQAPDRRRYALVMATYVLALLSKPMVVTLPLVLLLLDVWPLQRLAGSAPRPLELDSAGAPDETPRDAHVPAAPLRALLWEKVPLFALSGLVSVVTIAAQRSAGAIIPLDILPWRARLANVPISYLRYIGKALWPTGLAILYPYELHWPLWEVAGASLFLLVVTVALCHLGSGHRYALVGWLWFVMTLLPVIGILQVGAQPIADRYTYIPLIGLLILVTWSAHAVVVRWRHGPSGLALAGLLVVAACFAVTWEQVGHWRSSYSVFEHALAVTTDNAFAHGYLGKALLADGHAREAQMHFNETMRLQPFPPQR